MLARGVAWQLLQRLRKLPASPGLTDSPVTPSCSQSPIPPVALATTGRPAANASMPTSPNGSGHSDGTTTTDALASSSASSARRPSP